MEVRSTSASPGARGPGERSVPDRPGRAPIDSLESEPRALPPPGLAASRVRLALGESPSTITPDQRGHLFTMVSLCDDLLRLTRSYLDYAGIVQGSRPLCLGSFTIGALIDEIDRQFAPIASARQLDWETRADLPGDRRGHRRLTLPADLRQSRLERPEVHAARRTSACHWESRRPIPGRSSSQTRDRAFPPKPSTGSSSPSSACPATNTPAIEGSGLGLAICRELVTQLQGEIPSNSVAGQGTSISVRFPLTTEAGPSTRASPRPPAPLASPDRISESESSTRPAASATGSHRDGPAIERMMIEVVVKAAPGLTRLGVAAVRRSRSSLCSLRGTLSTGPEMTANGVLRRRRAVAGGRRIAGARVRTSSAAEVPMPSSPRRDPSRTSGSRPRSRSRLRASSSLAVRSPLSICSCTRRSSIERFSCSSLATDRFNCSFSYSRWLRLVLSWPTVGPPVRKLDRPEQPAATPKARAEKASRHPSRLRRISPRVHRRCAQDATLPGASRGIN